MKYSCLEIAFQNSICVLTITRPEKLNALSTAVLSELKHVLTDLKQAKRDQVRGLILTGSGNRAFIAGADIKEMNAMTAEEGERFGALGQEVSVLFESLPFPVIACVDGFALGGGCEMAMSCDFIYATERAMFGQPEVSLGLIPGFGGCVRLQKLISPSRAKELIYTGKSISASEAERIGLVNAVFTTTAEMLDAAIQSFQLMIANSPHAISICKRVINSSYGLTTATALQIEKEGFKESFQSEEKNEGTHAFLEKRPARFHQ